MSVENRACQCGFFARESRGGTFATKLRLRRGRREVVTFCRACAAIQGVELVRERNEALLANLAAAIGALARSYRKA